MATLSFTKTMTALSAMFASAGYCAHRSTHICRVTCMPKITQGRSFVTSMNTFAGKTANTSTAWIEAGLAKKETALFKSSSRSILTRSDLTVSDLTSGRVFVSKPYYHYEHGRPPQTGLLRSRIVRSLFGHKAKWRLERLPRRPLRPRE